MPTGSGPLIREISNGYLGADIAQLKDLGAKLQAGARELENQKNMLGRVLQNTDWKGPDAEFRNEWNTVHSNSLTKVAQALEEAGKHAVRNASQQEEASR